MNPLFLKSITCFLLVICFLLSFVTVYTQCWIYIGSGEHKHRGLWKDCNQTDCSIIDEMREYKADGLPGWLYVVRTFSCLAVICYFVSLTYYITACFLLQNSLHNFIVSGTILVSGVFMFITMSLYTRNQDQKEYKWGWGYILGWFCFFITLATFTISFYHNRIVPKDNERAYSVEPQLLEK